MPATKNKSVFLVKMYKKYVAFQLGTAPDLGRSLSSKKRRKNYNANSNYWSPYALHYMQCRVRVFLKKVQEF